MHTPTFWIALIATLLWVVLVWRVGRSMRRAVVNWAAGVTLIWVLAMTLWLPWLDSGKSYRGMVASLKRALPEQYNCLAGGNVGATQRAMLQYFGGIDTQRDAAQRLRPAADAGKQRMGGPAANKKEWKQDLGRRTPQRQARNGSGCIGGSAGSA